jgi:hypothetical protein
LAPRTSLSGPAKPHDVLGDPVHELSQPRGVRVGQLRPGVEVRADLPTALEKQWIRLVQQLLSLALADDLASHDEQVDVGVHRRGGRPHLAASRRAEHAYLG